LAEFPLLPAARRRPVPLILDTDMNEDVDDAGALAVMHALADRGLAEILALTYCTSAVWGVPAIQAINRWYGRPELAVGSFGRAGFIDEHADLSYIRFLAEAYQPAGRGTDDAPEALALLRRTLAARATPDVVLVGIGPLPNLAALLDSGPDDASPLSGDELIRRSVRKLVLMAGRIPEGIEYNLRQDPGAARRVLESWPTPVVICDGQLGGSIQAGARFCRESQRGNPVRTAYWLHAVGLDWACYDQAAVLAAVTGARYFRHSAQGRLEVDKEGRGRWVPDQSGNQRYLKARYKAEALSELIEDLMLAPPRLKPLGSFMPAAADEELLELRKAALAAHFRAAIDESLEELEAAE
jgi:hypothetical protein